MKKRTEPPDEARLRQLGEEVEALKAGDRWTEAEFRRLLPLWREACGREAWMVESLIVEADEEWLDDIVTVE